MPSSLISSTRVASDDTNSRSCDTKISVPSYFSSAMLQRLDRFHVHVVGRLVHQQHVMAAQHQLAVDHAALLAAGEHLHRFLDVVAGKQQASQDRRAPPGRRRLPCGPAVHPVGQGHVARQTPRSGPAACSRHWRFPPISPCRGRPAGRTARRRCSAASVVLPAPLAPMMAIFSPASTMMLKFLKMLRSYFLRDASCTRPPAGAASSRRRSG